MRWIAVVWLVSLSACAIGPRFDPGPGPFVDASPRDLASATLPRYGVDVLWGGVIVRVDNRHDGTRIEVLAYPLDRNGKPDTSEPSQGRFLLQTAEYLEPADHAPGRLLTVTAVLREVVEGKVGDVAYRFPVVELRRHRLWREELSAPWWGGIHFGISISN